MSSHQSDNVLYITLVDFLIQLLFLGLVLGVLYVATLEEQEKGKENADFIERAKRLTGISDLTLLTDELTRLGPLMAVAKYVTLGQTLEQKVLAVGGAEKASSVLSEYIKKNPGVGKPSCLPNKAILATVHAYEDRIQIKSSTGELTTLLKELKLEFADVSELTLKKFTSVFRPVLALHPDCSYNVELVEYTYDTRPRDAVGAVFRTGRIRRQP